MPSKRERETLGERERDKHTDRQTETERHRNQNQGGNSQKFLRQILKIFVTLGLKILGLLGIKVYF